LTTHTSFNPYHAASCEEISKKEAALGSIHPWRVLFHRAEGRGREEEGREGNRLWVHTVHVDPKSQVCSFLFPFDLISGSYLYGIGP
jgi:hypothetical protein